MIFFLYFLCALNVLCAADMSDDRYVYHAVDRQLLEKVRVFYIERALSHLVGGTSFAGLLGEMQSDVYPFVAQKETSKPDVGGMKMHFLSGTKKDFSVVIEISNNGKLCGLECSVPSGGAEIRMSSCIPASGARDLCDISLRVPGGENVKASVAVLGKHLQLISGDHTINVAQNVSVPLKKLRRNLAFHPQYQNFFFYLTMRSEGEHLACQTDTVCIMYDVDKNACFLDFFYELHCERYSLSSAGLRYIETRPAMHLLTAGTLEYGQYYIKPGAPEKDVADQKKIADAVVLHSHKIPPLGRLVYFQISRLFCKEQEGFCRLYSLNIRSDGGGKGQYFLQIKENHSKRYRVIFAGLANVREVSVVTWELNKELRKHCMRLGSTCFALASPSDFVSASTAALSIVVENFGGGKKCSAEVPLTKKNLDLTQGYRWNIHPNTAGCLVLNFRDREHSHFTLRFMDYDGFLRLVFRQQYAKRYYQDFIIFETEDAFGVENYFHYVIEGNTVFVHFLKDDGSKAPCGFAEVRSISACCVSIGVNWLPYFLTDCVLSLRQDSPLTFNKKIFFQKKSKNKGFCFFDYEERHDDVMGVRNLTITFDLDEIKVINDGKNRELFSISENNQCAAAKVDFCVRKDDESGRYLLEWVCHAGRYIRDFSHPLKSVQMMVDASPTFALQMKITDCNGEIDRVYILPKENNVQLCFYDSGNKEIKSSVAVKNYNLSSKPAPPMGDLYKNKPMPQSVPKTPVCSQRTVYMPDRNSHQNNPIFQPRVPGVPVYWQPPVYGPDASLAGLYQSSYVPQISVPMCSYAPPVYGGFSPVVVGVPVMVNSYQGSYGVCPVDANFVVNGDIG